MNSFTCKAAQIRAGVWERFAIHLSNSMCPASRPCNRGMQERVTPLQIPAGIAAIDHLLKPRPAVQGGLLNSLQKAGESPSLVRAGVWEGLRHVPSLKPHGPACVLHSGPCSRHYLPLEKRLLCLAHLPRPPPIPLVGSYDDTVHLLQLVVVRLELIVGEGDRGGVRGRG